MKKDFIKKAVEFVQIRYRWLKTWKSMPVNAWLRGDAMLKAGKYSAAIESYEKGLAEARLHRAAPAISLRLSHCYCKTGKFREALKVLAQIISEHRDFRDAYVWKSRLELWLCRPKDSIFTIEKAMSFISGDSEIAALYLLSTIDAGLNGVAHEEAHVAARMAAAREKASPLLRLALARYDYAHGLRKKGKLIITQICSAKNAPVEALIALGEIYLREGNVLFCRNYLRRALAVSPQHPRTQTLIAESYLMEGPGYQPEYALQLASNACKNSLWENPQAMHVLAEAFYQCGKKTDALLVANKAREIGSRIHLLTKNGADPDLMM